MAEITTLADIETLSLPTVAQIQAIVHKIDVTIYNITIGNGTFGGLDVKEADHSSNPTALLAELRRIRKMYTDALADPNQFEDQIGIIVSEWDNPDLPFADQFRW
jgi:hypothetical protein